MKRFLQHMKPDTGAQTLTPDRELYDWKRVQEQYRDTNALTLSFNNHKLALISMPHRNRTLSPSFTS